MNTFDNVIRLNEQGTLPMITRMRAEAFVRILTNLPRAFYPSELTAIRATIKELSGVDLEEDRLAVLFKLYPRTAALIDEGTVFDSEEASLMLAMVANFFLDCEWPIYKDNADFRMWHQALGVAVESMSPLLDYKPV